jgi:hypothetical protein
MDPRNILNSGKLLILPVVRILAHHGYIASTDFCHASVPPPGVAPSRHGPAYKATSIHPSIHRLALTTNITTAADANRLSHGIIIRLPLKLCRLSL